MGCPDGNPRRQVQSPIADYRRRVLRKQFVAHLRWNHYGTVELPQDFDEFNANQIIERAGIGDDDHSGFKSFW